jgi:hypothetical protein
MAAREENLLHLRKTPAPTRRGQPRTPAPRGRVPAGLAGEVMTTPKDMTTPEERRGK